MPWYRTGTVAITAGSTTVVGTGANFALNSRVGDAFQGPDGRWYEVANIASSTVLSILPAYQGATVAAGAYGLAPMQGYVKESADRLRQLVDQFGGTLALIGTATTPAQLRENIGAAGRGTNSDITSLTALSAPVVSSSTIEAKNLSLTSTTDALILGGVTHTPVAIGPIISIAKNENMVTEFMSASAITSWASRFNFLRARGTVAAPSVPAAGDTLGAMQFLGYGGSGYVGAAVIIAEVEAAPSGGNVPAKLDFRTASAASGLRTAWSIRSEGHLLPGADNAYDLGSASLRPRQLYAATGTISVSDAREKTAVRAFSPAELAAAKDLSREIGAFKFLSAVAEKGEAAREHVGMTVQRAMEVMESHGLNPRDYSFVCYDEWPDTVIEHPTQYEQVEVPPVLDEEGHEIEPAKIIEGEVIKEAYTEIVVPAGNKYSFRMDGLLAFIAAGLEARLTALEAA